MRRPYDSNSANAPWIPLECCVETWKHPTLKQDLPKSWTSRLCTTHLTTEIVPWVATSIKPSLPFPWPWCKYLIELNASPDFHYTWTIDRFLKFSQAIRIEPYYKSNRTHNIHEKPEECSQQQSACWQMEYPCDARYGACTRASANTDSTWRQVTNQLQIESPNIVQ